MIDATWPEVVLILGIVGFSLATVCFTIWQTRRPQPEEELVPWPGEPDTKIMPPK